MEMKQKKRKRVDVRLIKLSIFITLQIWVSNDYKIFIYLELNRLNQQFLESQGRYNR